MTLDEDKVKSLIRKGSEIAGPAAGGAIGYLIGGPGGAALGGALGAIIPKSIFDISNRILSRREEIRVGATAAFAITKIKSRRDAGDALRNDGFFEKEEKKRADAEEIFEGVLLKAKNEHEEKKTKILGNIFANTAFLPGFSVGEANYLLRVTENLTYKQICLMSLIKRKNEIKGIKLRNKGYQQEYETNKMSYETMSLLQQAYEMYNLGLVVCAAKPSESESIFWSMTEWLDVTPSHLVLTSIGKRYHQVMGLDDIPEEDVREVSRYLS